MLFLYNQNPNAGAEDGTLVSTGSDFANAIKFQLNSTAGEEKVEKCAIRCQSGYIVEGSALVSFDINDAGNQLSEEEETAIKNKWAFSLDGTTYSAFGESITVPNVEDKNVLVYVKCKAEQGEMPSNENRLQIVLEGSITLK